MKMKMIVQGEAMIPQSEPVSLALEGVGDQVSSELLVQTLNFLRCGVPAVQWILVESWNDMDGKKASIEFSSNLHDRLVPLQQPHERFNVLTPSSTGHLQWIRGAVITITRIIEPKTEETTFGALQVGDEYYLPADDARERRLKGQSQSQEYYSVFIEGINKGYVAGSARNDSPVLKILK